MKTTLTGCLAFFAASAAFAALPPAFAQPPNSSANPPAAAAAQTPTKPAVLAAIARMMHVVGENGAAPQTPKGASDKQWADDMKMVANFAEQSDAVTITISPRFLAVGSNGPDALLLAYYLAGAVRFDLQHPSKAKDPYADQAAAVRAELLAYRFAQSKLPKFDRPLLNTLKKAEASGKLDKYVADAARQDAAKAKPTK